MSKMPFSLSISWPWIKCIALFQCVFLCSSVFSKEILYVSAQGSDDWSGVYATPTFDHRDGPLKTLVGARNRLRELRAGQPEFFRDGVDVVIFGGIYRLVEPLIFSSDDGGSKGAPIRYIAAPNEQVIISGAKELSFTLDNSKNEFCSNYAFSSDVSSVYSGDVRMEPRRLPETGYFRMKGPNPAAKDIAGDLANSSFTANIQDVQTLRGLSPENLKKIVVTIYHAWQISKHRIKSINFDSGLVELGNPAPWRLTRWDEKQRYQLNGAIPSVEFGWYTNTDGYLCVPDSGINTDNENLILDAPRLERLVEIDGGKKLVTNIEFHGLIFQHAGYSLPSSGYTDRQASPRLPAAIDVDNATGIVFDDCVFRWLDAYAVWLRPGSSHSTIVNSTFSDIGGGGVKIGNVKFIEKGDLVENRISNNNFKGLGEIFHGAVGIWVGFSGGNVISENEISDLDYSAISVGWEWGGRTSITSRNFVKNNYLHDIGNGVLGDMGGIYTLGPAPDTVISGNIVANVKAYGYGGWGIYNDESTADIRVLNNLVYATDSGGYHLHYGRDIDVEGNIFLGSRGAEVQFSNGDRISGIKFCRNVIGGEAAKAIWVKKGSIGRFECDNYYPNENLDHPGGNFSDPATIDAIDKTYKEQILRFKWNSSELKRYLKN